MNLIDTFLEVELANPDAFLKVRETLSRIGIASEKQKTLWQSCHILHKQGRYFIVHFKSMFELDGKHSTLSDEDIKRTNTIAFLLEEWGLVKVLDRSFAKNRIPLSQIKILSFKEKNDWKLITKYNIGRRSN